MSDQVAVLMHRWGDDERHSYLLGVFASEEIARREARAEYENRGHKYDPELCVINAETGRVSRKIRKI